VRCSLDGRVIHDLKNPPATTQRLFASATRDDKSNEIILKVVNAAAEPTETEVNLAGISQVAGDAQLIVLTSADPRDENTLDDPFKVSPRTQTLKLAGPKFTRTFPGNSLTVIRAKLPRRG
jgi:alpha-L-arabinofuranosidase